MQDFSILLFKNEYELVFVADLSFHFLQINKILEHLWEQSFSDDLFDLLCQTVCPCRGCCEQFCVGKGSSVYKIKIFRTPLSQQKHFHLLSPRTVSYLTNFI